MFSIVFLSELLVDWITVVPKVLLYVQSLILMLFYHPICYIRLCYCVWTFTLLLDRILILYFESREFFAWCAIYIVMHTERRLLENAAAYWSTGTSLIGGTCVEWRRVTPRLKGEALRRGGETLAMSCTRGDCVLHDVQRETARRLGGDALDLEVTSFIMQFMEWRLETPNPVVVSIPNPVLWFTSAAMEERRTAGRRGTSSCSSKSTSSLNEEKESEMLLWSERSRLCLRENWRLLRSSFWRQSERAIELRRGARPSPTEWRQESRRLAADPLRANRSKSSGFSYPKSSTKLSSGMKGDLPGGDPLVGSSSRSLKLSSQPWTLELSEQSNWLAAILALSAMLWIFLVMAVVSGIGLINSWGDRLFGLWWIVMGR